jgi:hypothetical protein
MVKDSASLHRLLIEKILLDSSSQDYRILHSNTLILEHEILQHLDCQANAIMRALSVHLLTN